MNRTDRLYALVEELRRAGEAGPGEMLVHTFDITAGFGVGWRPPTVLAEVVLARLMPDVPRNDAPTALLWATGRIDVAGLPHVRDWVWRPAPFMTRNPAVRGARSDAGSPATVRSAAGRMIAPTM